MQIEEQVCSLELAKKLKELGVKQEGFFRYYTYDLEKYNLIYGYFNSLFPIKEEITAFTISELADMTSDKYFNLYGNKEEGYFFYINGEPNTYDYKLVDCMAKMVIKLIE